MSQIRIRLQQLVNEGKTPERFFDISGANEAVRKLQHITLGSAEDFQLAADDVSNILSIEESPESYPEGFPKLAEQLIGPNDDLSDEQKFNWYFEVFVSYIIFYF